MSRPLVSILVPCHNAAPWLAAALESTLAQTGQPIEVIVVDDGSTDESRIIAQRFAERGVRTLAQPQRGAAAARNAALGVARGEYVQFLDADDVLAPGKIAAQLARLESATARTVASGAWARFRREPSEAVFRAEPAWRDLSGLEFLLLHYEGGWMMQPAAWLCPRALLDEVGPWDERLTLNDDGEYFARVVLAAPGIRFCPEARCYYRSGLRGSLSRRLDPAALRSLRLSTELNCARLLRAAGESPRARAAAANGWQRLAFESYPADPRIAVEAELRCRQLGGSPFPLPAGRLFQWAARLIGWRAAKRLRDLRLGLHGN